MLTTIIATRHR